MFLIAHPSLKIESTLKINSSPTKILDFHLFLKDYVIWQHTGGNIWLE
jgi:hypothetical protein